jgi:RNA polymerase sigma-70 factor (family 1)
MEIGWLCSPLFKNKIFFYRAKDAIYLPRAVPKTRLHNEKALLNQVAQGDESAFRIVFDHYRDAIYTFACKVIQHETLAEEIVQDVFVKIWINRTGLSAVRQFPDFLFIIARNHTFNALRRLAREKKLPLNTSAELEIAGVSAEAVILQRDYDRLLLQAISQLPPQQKLVYTLGRQEGLTREEIAAQLQISPETVKVHMAKALSTLRTYFKDHRDGILFLIASILLTN